MVGEGSKWRWIFIDFNNNRVALFRPTPQIGRGIDDAGGPNRKEDVALCRSCDGRFESIGRQHFAKPNNVRPQISAARSTSAIFDIEVITRTIIFETAEAVKISVDLDDSFAAVASSSGLNLLHSPVCASRKVASSLSAEIPAPVRATILCEFCNEVMSEEGKSITQDSRGRIRRFL